MELYRSHDSKQDRNVTLAPAPNSLATEFGAPIADRATAQSPRGRFRVGHYVLATYVVVAISIALGCWTLIRQDHERQQHAQEIQLASLTRALQEYVSRSLQEANAALIAVNDDMSRLTGQPTRIQTQVLREKTAQQLALHPHIAAMAAYSVSAGETVITRQANIPQNITPVRPGNLDRALQLPFQILAPFRGAEGKWFLPLYLAVRPLGDQNWSGISILIDLDYIAAFYQDIRLSADDEIHLLDLKGHSLISFPADTQSIGNTLISANGLMPGVPTHEAAGLTNAAININGQTHIGTFSRLREFPLIVGTSRSQEAADAEFFEMRRRLILISTLLIALLGLLTWLFYYDIRRREASRQVLDELNASLEAGVRQRTAELEQSNRELVAFSYSVSHDLRAPLRAINGFAHALKEDNLEQLDAQGREYLERIYRASVRMGELIDELLNLANVSRAPLKLRPLDLAEIAREIVEDLRIASPGRKVEFHAPERLYAEGDETLLRNALYNLLHNAWKFTRSKNPALISLSVEEEAESIRYIVEDNGIGFDIAHAKRLFQPFQQLHVNQGYGGMGIGLASVRRIIERHGGSIWAESAPDAGARFIFVLPRPARVLRRRTRGTAQNETR